MGASIIHGALWRESKPIADPRTLGLSHLRLGDGAVDAPSFDARQQGATPWFESSSQRCWELWGCRFM